MAYLFAGILPFVLFPLYLGQLFPEWVTPAIVVMLLYGIALFAFSLQLSLTECPRCDRFYHLSWWANPFTKRCLNCGLRLAALDER